MGTQQDDPPSLGVIQIRVREIGQLFNSLDPSPFLEKDLDQEAEDYIVSWAREEPSHKPLAICIHLAKSESERDEANKLAPALNNFFIYRADMADRELRELFRYGRIASLIGLMVLSVCLFASHQLPALLGDGALVKLAQESLIILGWVAQWEPLEVALYDWLPIQRRRNLYRRLAAAQVQIKVR
jgi:hypothetical protein